MRNRRGINNLGINNLGINNLGINNSVSAGVLPAPRYRYELCVPDATVAPLSGNRGQPS
jgi:hypothetical protein